MFLLFHPSSLLHSLFSVFPSQFVHPHCVLAAALSGEVEGGGVAELDSLCLCCSEADSDSDSLYPHSCYSDAGRSCHVWF